MFHRSLELHITYLTGTLFNKSSSFSSSFICRSRTARYSLSRKSCSTSCHGLRFSSRRASFTLRCYKYVVVCKKCNLLAPCQCHDAWKIPRRRATLVPHSIGISYCLGERKIILYLNKNCVAKACTL